MAKLKVTPIVALDVSSATNALALAEALGDRCRFYKVGSELFTAAGPDLVHRLRGRGNDIFLDLKFHDIPNTVRGAARSAARLGVRLLTVHASGGREMVRAAADGVRDAGAECRVLAVTVLTSLDGGAVGAAWGRGPVRVEDEVLRLADLAADAGADGVVCSGAEASLVRDRRGGGFEILVPGVRLEGGATHDQARVITPAGAVVAGATYIVLGRAVTAAADPRAAMERVLAELKGAD